MSEYKSLSGTPLLLDSNKFFSGTPLLSAKKFFSGTPLLSQGLLLRHPAAAEVRHVLLGHPAGAEAGRRIQVLLGLSAAALEVIFH